ncbi:MAG TPA: hypothetical protein DCM45_07630, partial [Clostridiales bacterium]|nr:hypothetical protein [Clostridiales bacterium]
MKMIIRIDDVGYTNTCNTGAFQTIEQGIATAADVMLDTPGTEDALNRLRDFPWISVGWHTHFWGSPVLPAEQVPTLLMNDQGRVRFRKDLHEASDVNFDEALRECRAQLDRCVRILGRAPDTGMFFAATPMNQAIRQACDEYGIIYDFTHIQSGFPGMNQPPAVNPRWADRKIKAVDSMALISHLLADSIDEWEKYDPVAYFVEDQAHLLDFADDD